MIRLFVSIILALSAGAANAAPFLSKGHHATMRAMKLRGGAGPIEANTAARVAGGLALATGSVFTVGDKFCARAYGVEGDLSPVDAHCVTNHNLSILSAGLVGYCLLFRSDIDFNLAMAIGNLPWAMRALGELLNEDSERTGPSKMGSSLILAFCGAAVYSGMTAADWAGNAFKAASVFSVASGIPCLLAPSEASKLWGCKGTTELTDGMITGVGVTLTGFGAFMASLAWGDDIITAVGKRAIVDMLSLIKAMYFSPEWAAVGVDRAAAYFWLIFNAITAYSILA